MHFTTECTLYTDLRNELYNKLETNPNFMKLTPHNKFIWLLTNEDKATCKLVGKFLTECFAKRKEMLSDAQ